MARWTTVAAALALVAGHLREVAQPLAEEEVTWWFQLPQSWLAHGRFLRLDGTPWNDHPPLYGLMLAGVFRAAGVGAVQARLMGLVLGLAALLLFAWLARMLCRRLGREPGIVAVAVAVYALHPLVLQSTLALEPDTTLGPLAALLFATVAVRTRLAASPGAIVLCGVCLVPLLWTKVYLAAPPLVALAVAAGPRAGWRAAAGRAAGVGVLGGILSLAVWVPVSWALGMSAARPASYAAAASAGRLRALGPLGLAKDAVQVALWMSPVLLVLAGVVAVVAWRRSRHDPGPCLLAFVAVWGVVHVAVSTVVVGSLYGFPKYQAAALPFLVLAAVYGLGARTPSTARAAGTAVALGAIAALALFRPLGDVLHALRIEVKSVALTDAARLGTAEAAVVARVLAYLLVPAALVLVAGRLGRARTPSLGPALLAAHVGLAGGLLASQLTAGYATRYGYGERGLHAAVALVTSSARPGEAIAPPHVSHYLGAPPIARGVGFWDGEDGELLRAVHAPATSSVIFSIANQTMRQLTYLERDATLARALAAGGFRRARVGTFVVWWR